MSAARPSNRLIAYSSFCLVATQISPLHRSSAVEGASMNTWLTVRVELWQETVPPAIRGNASHSRCLRAWKPWAQLWSLHAYCSMRVFLDRFDDEIKPLDAPGRPTTLTVALEKRSCTKGIPFLGYAQLLYIVRMCCPMTTISSSGSLGGNTAGGNVVGYLPGTA